jgi:hypothetical protein
MAGGGAVGEEVDRPEGGSPGQGGERHAKIVAELEHLLHSPTLLSHAQLIPALECSLPLATQRIEVARGG